MVIQAPISLISSINKQKEILHIQDSKNQKIQKSNITITAFYNKFIMEKMLQHQNKQQKMLKTNIKII